MVSNDQLHRCGSRNILGEPPAWRWQPPVTGWVTAIHGLLTSLVSWECVWTKLVHKHFFSTASPNRPTSGPPPWVLSLDSWSNLGSADLCVSNPSMFSSNRWEIWNVTPPTVNSNSWWYTINHGWFAYLHGTPRYSFCSLKIRSFHSRGHGGAWSYPENPKWSLGQTKRI